jgi:hypothetical protein
MLALRLIAVGSICDSGMTLLAPPALGECSQLKRDPARPTTSFGSSGARPTSWFGVLASKTAQLSGKPAAFILAALIVVVWAVTGPVFHYSDTWQLVINTGTTVITFLMVFLIQNTHVVKADPLVCSRSNDTGEAFFFQPWPRLPLLLLSECRGRQ